MVGQLILGCEVSPRAGNFWDSWMKFSKGALMLNDFKFSNCYCSFGEAIWWRISSFFLTPSPLQIDVAGLA